MILAGGLGTRLRSVVADRPKPMAPIGDIPFLEYILLFLARQGFREIILLIGHLGEQITEYFGTGEKWGLRIDYSAETEPLGTGGAIRQAFVDHELDRALVLNGDTFFDLDLRAFVAFAEQRGDLPSLALKLIAQPRRYGTVHLEGETITEFKEKDETLKEGLINAGVYFLNRAVLTDVSDRKFSIETAVFSQLARSRHLRGVIFAGRFIDIGIPEDYRRAEENLVSWTAPKPRRRAVFLDRDNTLIRDNGYVHRVEDLEFLEGAVDFLVELQSLGFLLVIVTNQAGIAKGKFLVDDYLRFQENFQHVLFEKGIRIAAAYYCPYHEDGTLAEYRRSSYYRKPNPGMLLTAAEDLEIDLASSFMIGDKASDRIALPYLRTFLLGHENSFSTILKEIRHESSNL